MKNVLITGGAGFIGSALAIKLLAQGCQVTVLDNLSPQIHGPQPEENSPLYVSIRGKVQFVQASILDREALVNALQGVDSVVHLAAETGTGQSMYAIEHYCQVNVQGTALLLDVLTNMPHNVRTLVVASSRAVYGEGSYHSAKYGTVHPAARTEERMLAGQFEPVWKDDTSLTAIPSSEEATPSPSSVYAISKLTQEQLVLTVCKALGVKGVALRYQNVYGPGQSLSNPYTGILSIFSKRILNGQPINIFEDGRESRDFVFIDDVVQATFLALQCPQAANQCINVGTGVAISVLQVVEALQACYGRYVPAEVTGAFRLGDIRHNFADISRLKQLLDFAPKTNFEDGIAKFTRWVLAQQIMEDNSYEQSLAEMRNKGLMKA